MLKSSLVYSYNLSPKGLYLLLQAVKGRLLRVLGAVLLAAGASHAYNWWIGLQQPLVAASWGGGSALLGALCLLRAAWRPASGGAGAWQTRHAAAALWGAALTEHGAPALCLVLTGEHPPAPQQPGPWVISLSSAVTLARGCNYNRRRATKPAAVWVRREAAKGGHIEEEGAGVGTGARTVAWLAGVRCAPAGGAAGRGGRGGFQD